MSAIKEEQSSKLHIYTTTPRMTLCGINRQKDRVSALSRGGLIEQLDDRLPDGSNTFDNSFHLCPDCSRADLEASS